MCPLQTQQGDYFEVLASLKENKLQNHAVSGSNIGI
jgi:hypothetical protein